MVELEASPLCILPLLSIDPGLLCSRSDWIGDILPEVCGRFRWQACCHSAYAIRHFEGEVWGLIPIFRILLLPPLIQGDQIKRWQTSQSSVALQRGELVIGGRKGMEKNETSGRREVAPSPFCTFLRKNWRSERVALLMPVIKIGGSRVEMGLVCEMDTHTCIYITALQEKRHPPFWFQSFHRQFPF